MKKYKIKICIIDLGISNLTSMINGCNYLNYNVSVSNSFQRLKESDVIILPGVGAFPYAMKQINSAELNKKLSDLNLKKKTIVGICLGMQLMTEESFEHVHTNGIGLIEGKTECFTDKSINTGWNSVKSINGDKNHFYFTHSYYVKPKNNMIITSTSTHNGTIFCSSFLQDKKLGFQFHPEKSGIKGLNFLDKAIRETL